MHGFELYTKTISVTVLRNKSEPELLLLKRADSQFNGLWTHVYGSIQKGEMAWETAIREVQEETSLEIVDLYSGEYCEQFYVPSRNAVSIVPVFVAFVCENSIVTLNYEHSDYKWCTFDMAEILSEFPGHKNLYVHVKTHFSMSKPSHRLLIDFK